MSNRFPDGTDDELSRDLIDDIDDDEEVVEESYIDRNLDDSTDSSLTRDDSAEVDDIRKTSAYDRNVATENAIDYEMESNPPESAPSRSRYRNSDEENHAFISDLDESRSAAKAQTTSSAKFKDFAFGIMCLLLGFAGVAIVICGVIYTCKSLSSKTVATTQTTQQVASAQTQAIPEGSDVYYDDAGRMHVNIYVEKEPNINVNIKIDGDGNTEVDTNRGDANVSENDVTDENTIGEPNTEGTPNVEGAPKTDTEPVLEEMPEEETEEIEEPEGEDVVYTIVWGDTLSALSAKTGYSVEYLAEYNNIKNPNLIIAGHTLRYPKKW